MERRKFGSTGIDVPVIGQGTWEIGREAVKTLREGLDLGLTHIDTAEMYGSGRAEELVAEAIAGRRDEVFLVSKVLPSNAGYEGTLRACERSLERLGTDHLDVYLLHWESSYPIGETMRAMERLMDQRQIHFAGVSNLDLAAMKAAQAALRHHKLACNQVLYHPRQRGIERKLIPYCAEQGIAVVAYTPFGRTDWDRLKTPAGKVLAEIAKRNGRTVRQVILNFLTRWRTCSQFRKQTRWNICARTPAARTGDCPRKISRRSTGPSRRPLRTCRSRCCNLLWQNLLQRRSFLWGRLSPGVHSMTCAPGVELPCGP